MEFLSFDAMVGVECNTEIRPAQQTAAREFSLTWDPYVDEKIATDRDFNYRIFESGSERIPRSPPWRTG